MRRILYLFLLIPQLLWAGEDNQETDSLATAIEEYDYMHDSIVGKRGLVFMEEAHAYINVPEGYCYLPKNEANHLLAVWGNPENDEILGALVADSCKIYYDVEVGFMFFYEDCGYVSDEDANSYSYDEILKDKQAQAAEWSEERVKSGFDSYELVGWATAPVYDSEKKALYWAQHLRFHGEEEDNEVLNYDVRILGRNGILTINAVASMDDLAKVEELKKLIIENSHFNEGYTYADFNPSTDHIAEWGIGALVAGKVLAKAGILAKLGTLLLKFWKPLVLAVGALITFLVKRRKEEE
ncbi:MAG: DUF2167 domain-containing protein [Paludibacteraceae bacterium]|nr:DUF2167 domain-containing protein [Paludibacteraceae bacterium]